MTGLLSEEIQKFILDHENDDLQKLLLKHAGSDLPIKEIVEQISGRRKAKLKLPDWYDTEGIVFPPAISMEQCSSQLTARYKCGLIKGDVMTDLTGGFGVDVHYFAKVFQKVNYVDPNNKLLSIVEHNTKVFGQASTISFICATAESAVTQELVKSDCYYIDPSRRDGTTKKKVFLLEDCQPRLSEILPKLQSEKSKVMIKLAPMLDIKGACDEIPNVSEVYVVAINNECKELLFLINGEAKDQQTLRTIDLASEQSFDFTFEEETTCDVNYGQPQTFLYEPNVAILKAGAFKSVANRFGLTKLHPNTHLYTSEKLVKDFPGRTFRINEYISVSKKSVRNRFENDKCNLAIRNFPDSVESLRKKLKLKDGGQDYVFATTLHDDSKCLLSTHKI